MRLCGWTHGAIRGRETLLLRLLGAGAVLRGALKELNRLPEEAWEWDVVGNILLALREYHAYHPHQEGQEGGVAAAQEILRTLLRMRFGEVAPDLDAALSAVRDLQQLQLLTPTIAAGTTDAIREALTERQ